MIVLVSADKKIANNRNKAGRVNEVQIIFRVSAELKKSFDLALVRRGLTMKEAATSALREYLKVKGAM